MTVSLINWNLKYCAPRDVWKYRRLHTQVCFFGALSTPTVTWTQHSFVIDSSFNQAFEVGGL